ncbi:MAG: alcohol dehydrogenase catalytic domain-containing protein, partial [Pseudonocardia sp.]|nr:alcohol dehydrogenase catalytic domain-containing protein [Pseudonocardia sp.]
MRAAVLRKPGKVVIEERPIPRAGAGQVVVRVRAVGVCGSDTHYYEHGRIGRFVVEAPLVLGHEAAGEVTDLGPGVTRLVAGQRVSIEPGVPDLTCGQCLAGRYNLCANMRFFGT